jgi:hypothetical protein
MWSRLYRNHVIIAFPSYHTATNAWAPQADITWFSGASRDFKFVRFAKRCTTEDDAVNWALTRSQVWIDNRLRRLNQASQSELEREGNEIRATTEHLGKASPKPPARVQSATGQRLKRTFTFEQFKSAIAARGLKLSEPLLRKSYAALVSLRNHKHWSWDEARRRVKHSQQNLTVPRSPRRRPRAAPIPITELDWRRIR